MNKDFKGLIAVFVKNWKVSLVVPWALLTIFFWPTLDVITMGYISLYINQKFWNISQVQGISYMQFMITGAIFWSFINVTIMEISQMWDRERWEETLRFTFRLPIKKWVFLLGNTLFGVSRAFIATITALIFSWIVFGMAFGANIFYILFLFVLTVGAVYGLCILLATAGLLKREIEAIAFALVWILNLFSGIYYPISVLPDWMQAVGKVFPIYYAVDAMRAVSVYGQSLVNITGHIIALIGFSAIFTAIGLLVFNIAERRVRMSGEIGAH